MIARELRFVCLALISLINVRWTKDFEGRMKLLFSLQEDLYNAGARNFLFIDVPPINRSPACELQ